ncbi:MAG: serine hydrolase domain-containing protein, partial [Bacteroidia bacterium]
MKKALRIALYSAGIVGLLILLMWLSPYRYLIKGIQLTYLRGQTTSHYLDWKDFDTREVAHDPEQVKPFALAPDRFDQPLSEELQAMLERTHSGSYLVVLRDTLVMERYFEPFNEGELANSFSMAKTITALLTQIAIQEGTIASWDEPVRRYLPWVGQLAGEKNQAYEKFAESLTLRHRITMTAGLDWDESYTAAFGITAKAYYGSDVEATMRQIAVFRQPGTVYEYQSGATQLLGLALSQAVGKPLAEFASEKLWTRIGAEAPARWQLDRENGKELNYCCFDARSRDFAKLGRLVL